MTRFTEPAPTAGGAEPLLVATELEAMGAGVASPLAMPAFFLAWAVLGMVLADAAHGTPHLRRSMLAVGAGLGPMAAVVTFEARRRRRAASEIVIAEGSANGGGLDVLVLLRDCTADVTSVVPTLDAIAADVGSVTLAMALPDLWLDEDPAEAVAGARSVLVAASGHLRDARPGLVVYPDTTSEEAAARFSGDDRMVLFASDHALSC